jgi:uncharacterized DUF497 family protein
MEFEWDEEKRLKNFDKHGIDFDYGQLLFDGRPYSSFRSTYEGEDRRLIVGEIDGIFYTAIWTRRGDAIRIISVRRSRDAEKRHYREIHGGGN